VTRDAASAVKSVNTALATTATIASPPGIQPAPSAPR